MHTSEFKPMLIEKEFKVNGYDIDVMGIVSNIVYVRWFEDLRFKLLDIYCPYEELFANNQSPILSSTELTYKYPVTIYDKPIGSLWVSNLERAKWEVSIEIKTNGRLNCSGKQSGYFFDLIKKKPVAVPEVLTVQYMKEVNMNQK